jgi:hypothetical protein
MPEGHDDVVPIAARLVELACDQEDFDRVPGFTLRYMQLRPTEYHVALQVARFLHEKAGAQATYDLLVALWTDVPATRVHPDIAQAIGQVAEEAGEDQEALRWYEKVMEAGPVSAGFLTNLAQLLIRNGMNEAAAEVLRAARAQVAAGEGKPRV